jgi:YHS domain-containing protein
MSTTKSGSKLFAAVRLGETMQGRLPIDPVCRMVVDTEHAAGRLAYEGDAYYFCSLTCAGLFAQQPDRYTAA